MKKIIKSGYFKVFIVTVIVVASASTGYLLVRAQSASDSFLNTNFIAETWRTTVNTSEGKVTLEERSCDSDYWLCTASDVCANQLGDGDYIIVAKQDFSTTTTFQWKTSQTYCYAPHCEVIGGGATLVADNTLDFSEYPARDACKDVGGRLPTRDELLCMYDEFRTQDFAPADYWSASEHNETWARRVNFSDGSTIVFNKTNSYRVRCVFGW